MNDLVVKVLKIQLRRQELKHLIQLLKIIWKKTKKQNKKVPTINISGKLIINIFEINH